MGWDKEKSKKVPKQPQICRFLVLCNTLIINVYETSAVYHGQQSVQVQFEDDLGVVDFHPASHVGVIYVSEADVVGATGYKRKCARLRKANTVRGVVLVERTPASEQYYQGIQTVCGLEMGLTIIPVSGQDHAASFLVEMVHAEAKPDNPLQNWAVPVNYSEAVMTTLLNVPGLGRVKAQRLLQRFRSLRKIGTASQQDLAQVVGLSCAEDVWKFFNESL